MKLKLHDREIKLYSELSVGNRMALANSLINDNPLDFTMTSHSVADFKVKIRLDTLGTYILNAVDDVRTDVMSRYKEKRRPFQERSIGTFTSPQVRDSYEQLFYSANC